MQKLIEQLRRFTEERDWERFHSPKNLVMALSVEVAEIVEHFQWLSEEESRQLSREKLAELKDEIGDVLIYLTNLADKFHIDPIRAAEDKLEKNKSKYPVDRVKGKSWKYTEY
jgi:NTP pyrophosphatase (non-canonical NTP hydrolase)